MFNTGNFDGGSVHVELRDDPVRPLAVGRQQGSLFLGRSSRPELDAHMVGTLTRAQHRR